MGGRAEKGGSLCLPNGHAQSSGGCVSMPLFTVYLDPGLTGSAEVSRSSPPRDLSQSPALHVCITWYHPNSVRKNQPEFKKLPARTVRQLAGRLNLSGW